MFIAPLELVVPAIVSPLVASSVVNLPDTCVVEPIVVLLIAPPAIVILSNELAPVDVTLPLRLPLSVFDANTFVKYPTSLLELSPICVLIILPPVICAFTVSI